MNAMPGVINYNRNNNASHIIAAHIHFACIQHAALRVMAVNFVYIRIPTVKNKKKNVEGLIFPKNHYKWPAENAHEKKARNFVGNNSAFRLV